MRPHHTAPSPMAGLNRRKALILTAAATAFIARPGVSAAATAQQLTQNSHLALDRLFALHPQTRAWARDAKAVLVFPEIVKAGFMFGGQGGDGALLVRGKAVGFYRTGSASFGLQAGAQKFSYALFFMTDKALQFAKNNDGWSIGSGPSFVMVDEGMAKSLNTTTMRKDVYGIVWGQKGLMGGIGLEGTKVSRIHPKAS